MDLMATIHDLKLWMASLLVAVLCMAGGTAHAAGPIETSVFAVQGVDVDVTDTDAATAKNKALIAAQVKAFAMLAERLGNAELVDAVSKFEEKKVLPYLKSLSIEQESISPGRYQGKLTVRFLPAKIKSMYESYGVQVSSEQGPAFLVLPVWKQDGNTLLWEDNPWRQAWINLRAEQSLVPIIVPLGDLDDSEQLTLADLEAKTPAKMEAIRRRYDVKAVVVAYAEPAEGGGVHAQMSGDSPLGTITFDKVYTADSGNLTDSLNLAAERFHTVMLEKYKSNQSKVAAAKAAAEANKRHGISVSVAFGGPSEWNGIRSRIMATPGVVGLQVASLAANGAVVNLAYMGSLEEMQSSLQASGLSLQRQGDGWVIAQL